MTAVQRWALPAVAVLSLAAIAMALVSQHVYDMQPCPWCVLQRLIFALIGLVSLAALALRRPLARRLGAAAALLLAVCGIATALWQHFVAAASASCNLTLADRIVSATGLDGLVPQVFAAYASCADAHVEMFGLSYELYSLALFVVVGALAWRALRGA